MYIYRAGSRPMQSMQMHWSESACIKCVYAIKHYVCVFLYM